MHVGILCGFIKYFLFLCRIFCSPDRWFWMTGHCQNKKRYACELGFNTVHKTWYNVCPKCYPDIECYFILCHLYLVKDLAIVVNKMWWVGWILKDFLQTMLAGPWIGNLENALHHLGPSQEKTTQGIEVWRKTIAEPQIHARESHLWRVWTPCISVPFSASTSARAIDWIVLGKSPVEQLDTTSYDVFSSSAKI